MMQIDIEDRNLLGFNQPAKDELKKSATDFIDELIKESNRIESSRNPSSGNPQITSGMVTDATVFVRRGLIQPKKKIRVKVLRVISAIVSLLVGIIYDATKLQDKTYMLIFIVVVAIAIISVTISTIME
ncbi:MULTISPECIES: hypothetical protein [Enterobacterales]|uniref:hypothetical protein n=1 Tax=Enterobacterales TaxID=91347 RepID=UPI0008FD1AC6|nr:MULTISPECIES: hypothetical protein [Enterobacteriaceae]HCI6433674.1 hypothetical protein [Klebsiella quasipneumoniae subsp. similipneumoniae]EKV4364317.1 hypothetical protein [Citrobacter freundii]EKW3669844.1 hypothetical protein [Citrobacter freundii]ELE2064622.1 hypothetical protein [Citrobacter freundii]ELI7001191.1 hypothetical protein [Citrobacter freundii]